MQRRFLIACVFLAALAVGSQVFGDGRDVVGRWTLDGNLLDTSGRGNDAFATSPAFVPGHGGQGLQCGQGPAIVADSPDLRLAPGLRIECWVKLDSLGTTYQPLVAKERAYQLRVDPLQEGGRFSFFVHLGKWEPRVYAKSPAKVGVWHHVIAGWDGKQIWIDVDGQRTNAPRSGVPSPSDEPLKLGLFHGVLNDVHIENPAAPSAGVAQWLFDGNLRDSSKHGRDLSGKDVAFVPVEGGQALQCKQAVQVASDPDLQLAPGLRIDCSVCFEKLPAEGRCIFIKDGEYQLRLNSKKEGSCFAFFVNLGQWEPRVYSKEPIKPGRWYRLRAAWDGAHLTLDVNGEQNRANRTGLAKPTNNPLVVGGPDESIDNLKIENPRLPVLLVRNARQEHAILLAGRPERMTTTVCNVGTVAEHVAVRLKLPPDTRSLGPTNFELGDMPTGAEKTIAWGVEADKPTIGIAEIQVAAGSVAMVTARHQLSIFPGEAGPATSALKKLTTTAGNGKATTYYVDSVAGNNANAGTSPDMPWKDFTNVNNRTLGPGERLLLRRGSVFNQELVVSARGTADNWVEIGAYGDGARPIIRRDGDIGDRCVLIKNPDFLHIHSLVVCYAAKGLIVNYAEPGHCGLLIEDCIAHHIEGLYRPNAHGIPEWRDHQGPTGDGVHNSPGIAFAGVGRDLTLRNCEMFQCSSGYFAAGDDVVIDRVYCHDNYAHNTSPHPFLVSVRRAILRNSIFDASGWHASAGTMGIMLADMQGLIIRNCFFRNQPDSGSADEGGIDFECRGNSCLIDHCTFENNAGAAIEMLGLQSPQTTNVDIRNSRFIKNNTAKKLGPAEVFVWGESRDPSVCCSTGVVQGCGYVLRPGVEFFVNQAPRLTSWTLRDNTQYATVAEIDRAMPFNRPPKVKAGDDIRTDQQKVALSGQVVDDGNPAGQKLSVTWELLEGPGRVTFADAHAATTQATFDKPGDYILRLVADDGELWASDKLTVHILPPGLSVITAWEFNKNLDKEGWTEVNPGTSTQHWANKPWPTVADPVKLVCGGYYVLAIENSTDAQLLSADHLGVDLNGKETLTIRFQNHTPATQMRVRFTTEADAAWNDAKSRPLVVVANDRDARVYTIDMSGIPTWKGRLRQLRIDLATGQPLTGTCRFDYIWISRESTRE